MNRYYAAIAQRASHRCEYCQAPELIFNFPFEVEHIIPLSRQSMENRNYGKIRLLEDVNTDLGDRCAVHTIFIESRNFLYLVFWW
ncbi:hypothetical protein LC605_25405 [Nostoc sp. CHAB 5836]|uniref:HNH endonuclease n=1 Tax=Nostoc sp. CHAB 5836 TaxID=2780404 RepID=UPI001E506625|nr:hypothetical protein [Nostoc sp. CHAB 5836]MCC5618360.1 hypothetical protein [Nostoc sp. CHAB 5836]